MKEITLNNKEYLLVEVPHNSYNFVLGINNLQFSVDEPYFSGFITVSKWIPFSENILSIIKDSAKIVGLLSKILKDEDICHNLAYNELKSVGYVYLDWQQPDNEKRPYKFDKPSDSFTSYLQSIELDMTKEYLLIQKL